MSAISALLKPLERAPATTSEAAVEGIPNRDMSRAMERETVAR